MTPALRVLEHNLVVYRRVWRGSMMVSFLAPILFLAAMGIGLGGLVNRSSGGVGGAPYLLYLAPGLLAVNTMTTAAVESTYPIMAKVYWERTYEGMLATPLRAVDLLFGEAAWLTFRMAVVATFFFVVMALFGVVHGSEALLAVPAAVLNGLAFALPILAFSATQRGDNGFSLLQRFLLLPLFMFGGAFFPIERLPALLQALAWLTPLSHGVALTRGLTLGTLALPAAALHVTVLLLFIGAGLVAASITLRRRLVL
ncbi:MAG TPA: ABC transporter permease [Candidatus Acidoferrales bacterium]|nr:ABC transporter permease [Candidatus Acidoferrales bacterium]